MQDKEDLHYITSKLAVKINVNDLVYELIGEISSDEETSDEVFEQYLFLLREWQERNRQEGSQRPCRTHLFLQDDYH